MLTAKLPGRIQLLERGQCGWYKLNNGSESGIGATGQLHSLYWEIREAHSQRCHKGVISQ